MTRPINLSHLANFGRRRFLTLVLPAFALFGCGSQMNTPLTENTKEPKPMTAKPLTPLTPPPGREVATLAGGCFWCTEAIFADLKGVDKVESGYAGGDVPNPSYDAVCNKRTGHAESLQITYDPTVISYSDLLHIFLTTHDPTTLNRQGADSGPQYRSAIFTHSEAQKAEAQKAIADITQEKVWKDPIVTEITPFTNFYKAENYHQQYYALNGHEPYCRLVIEPKVAKFRQKYAAKLKTSP